MDENRRLGSPEKPRQADLASGGSKQVFATNHEIHVVPHVVDYHRELVRPVAESVAQQKVATLGGRVLRLLAEQPILESLVARLDAESEPSTRIPRQPPIAAASAVPGFDVGCVSVLERHLLAGAIAGVDR